MRVRQAPMLAHGVIALIIGLTPVWYRLPDAPPPFTQDYITGFAQFWMLILTLLIWALSGFNGLNTLLKNPITAAWLVLFLAIPLWMYLSQNWAFMRVDRPEIAAAMTLQFALIGLFVITILCLRPPLIWIIYGLAASLVINGLIGALQVAIQSSIGLDMIGEFTLDPQQLGTSVIQSGDTRWLRPYGLSPHPNIYAGFIAASTLISSRLLFTENTGGRLLGAGIVLFGFWMLLLTFSRGAWLGFTVGAVFLAILERRVIFPALRQRFFRLFIAAGILAGFVFIALYYPLILERTGTSQEATETRSLNDRAIYNEVAVNAIESYPLLGVGAGNFPWYASHYLFYETDLNMRGGHVHNIYLHIQSELGVVGTILFIAIGASGLTIVLQNQQYETTMRDKSVLLAGIIILPIIGIVDHYPWTLFHYGTFWWGILAACLVPSQA